MNKIEISRELLSEVLELKRIDEIYIEDNILYFCELNKGINTYELAHKCKEWAMSKGYQIISGLSDEPAYRPKDERAYSKVLWYEGDDIHREYKDMYFMANTEVKAVIKASEYILKELNENR